MKCVKCDCPEHDENASYCKNCGHELDSNYCTNDHCALNNGDRIPCDEESCYCPECGSETEYFTQELIKPIDYKSGNQ